MHRLYVEKWKLFSIAIHRSLVKNNNVNKLPIMLGKFRKFMSESADFELFLSGLLCPTIILLLQQCKLAGKFRFRQPYSKANNVITSRLTQERSPTPCQFTFCTS